ncbi:MAG: hypothetical protein HC908_06605 [Calothrix sp. SM1_7_51]|nr:hypothetical protein [Calothrix sp. SM1_7_51]
MLNMPKRVRAYTALAEEKYDLPVYPVLGTLEPEYAIGSDSFADLTVRMDLCLRF